MAVAELIQPLTMTAGAVVRLYRFVQVQSDGKLDEVGVAQARADGVAAEAAAADGDTFLMAQMTGRMKVELGATVAAGAEVASDDEGRAITKVAAAGNFRLGVCLVGGDVGEIGEILLQSPSEDGGAS